MVKVPDHADKKEAHVGRLTSLLRKQWIFLVIPYLIGIVWTSVHPIISVMTGKLKCRGFYIDENALDASVFRIDSNYDVIPKQVEKGEISLCATLRNINRHISCYQHSSEFDVAKIAPTSNAVEPTAEAIVLVVPAPVTGTWTTSEFHHVILQLIHRLSQPQSCPWLAKTVLLVSSRRDNIPMDETVSQFLTSYLGPNDGADQHNVVEYLPSSYTSAIIRTLLVLDVQLNETGRIRNELQILPQGRQGVLPNMDLVFVAVSVFLRARFLEQRRHVTASLLVHPYEHESARIRNFVETYLPQTLRHWANDLGNMILFSYSLVVGPFPPHGVALDRGIDSLSLIARLEGQPRPTLAGHVVEFVQNLELIVRALSNLHERLHHSITLYLLPSPTTFVAQGEYLVPTILVLLPLVLRAGILLLLDLKTGLHLRIVGCGLLMSALSTIFLMMIPLEDPMTQTTYMAILYSVLFYFLQDASSPKKGVGKDEEKSRQHMIKSLQFVACLLAIYAHAPLLFANVSLAYPSGLLWTPLLSFPNYGELKFGSFRWGILFLIILGSWPPVFIAPRVFGGYTDYVKFAFTPLHVLLSSLCFLVR